jgi:hypothetical protein
MKKPNFFIVGAPKCGTTALYEYLKTHPQIFMSSIKEPHYFSDDLSVKYRVFTDENTYLEKCFSGAGDSHKAVGEASVWYLYSNSAIENIRAFNPDSRIIVMLRDPAEMLHSLHSQLIYNFYEEEKDFIKALGIQEERKQGKNIPPLCPEPAFLQYRAVASFGEQLQRIFTCFPIKQIKVIFFDDFTRTPVTIYAETLDFLGVPQDGRADFPMVNANKRHRIEWLGKMILYIPPPLIRAANALKKLLGIKQLGITNLINRFNRVEISRTPLPENIRREIIFALHSDIELVECLTGRDLAHWKSATGQNLKTAGER